MTTVIITIIITTKAVTTIFNNVYNILQYDIHLGLGVVVRHPQNQLVLVEETVEGLGVHVLHPTPQRPQVHAG